MRRAYSTFSAAVGLPAGLPFSVAVFVYLSPSFVSVVTQPVSQVITAALPSSFQLPARALPPSSPLATPSSDSQIVKAWPLVFSVFHLPTNPLAPNATVAKARAAAATVALVKKWVMRRVVSSGYSGGWDTGINAQPFRFVPSLAFAPATD
jgi:hypothetical protein